MVKMIKNAWISFYRLFYPRTCGGCGCNLITGEEHICLNCLQELIPTNFTLHKNNQFYRIFSARLPIIEAASLYYFTKGGIIQNILHEIKYKENRALAVYMGEIFGKKILEDKAFEQIEIIVPIPLHPKRMKFRGYNQSELIVQGISNALQKRNSNDCIKRVLNTDTQTNKGRSERWDNMKEAFELGRIDEIKGKHILLFDDVITTGATLEACSRRLLEVEGVKISLATLAYADEL